MGVSSPLKLLQFFLSFLQRGSYSQFSGLLLAYASVFAVFWLCLSGEIYIRLLSACTSLLHPSCLIGWLYMHGPHVGQALNGCSFCVCFNLCLSILCQGYSCSPFNGGPILSSVVCCWHLSTIFSLFTKLSKLTFGPMLRLMKKSIYSDADCMPIILTFTFQYLFEAATN